MARSKQNNSERASLKGVIAMVKNQRSSHQITCSGCHETFDSVTTTTELDREFEALYGHLVGNEKVISLCDTCYELLLIAKGGIRK